MTLIPRKYAALRRRAAQTALTTVFAAAAVFPAQARTVEYDLTVAYGDVNYSGKTVRAMTLNGGVPGPVLRFREGDTARIRVHNRMDVETSVHWHGLLVPNDQDGVPYVTYPPIAPGTTFTYEFPLRQAGTYWYHSHTGLQEQRGLYGSIVIEPRRERHSPDRDHVVMLSDWTDEDPHTVLRTLKRGSDWYSIRKKSAQSILGAAMTGHLGDYVSRELQRMPPMDISDIAYDSFLVNGKPETAFAAAPGDTVRLRIIDGGASTNFHLEFAGGPMTIVAADGVPVEPIREQRFLIAIAETYDVLVTVPRDGSWEFRATAHDGTGHASVWLGAGERHAAPAIPMPNLYHAMGGLKLGQVFALTPRGSMGMRNRDVRAGKFDAPGMMGMGSMDMGGMDMGGQGAMEMATGRTDHGGMDMDGMEMTGGMDMGEMDHGGGGRRGPWFLTSDVASSPSLAVDGMDSSRPGTPYKRLRAMRPTTLPGDAPVREVRLTLDGDMERYVWMLNGKTLSEEDRIPIRRGEVVRFIMINRTMMHHPMHLHGHFFRVVNGQGDYAPLKHTVNVGPMETTVIEFEADEFGDWFFHCHLLYHMKSGMARVVHYEGYELDPALAAIRPELLHDSIYFWGQADIMSNMTQGFLTLSNTRNILGLEWEVGWDRIDDVEWEAIMTWDRYLNRYLTAFVGADLDGVDGRRDEARAIAGVRYLLPLNVESRIWVDSDGDARVTLGKVIDLTPRLAAFGEAEYDTRLLWEGRAGLSYTFNRDVSLIGQWHSEYGFGGGLTIRF